MYGGTCPTICVWKSENNSVRSVVFFHLNVGCGDQTQEETTGRSWKKEQGIHQGWMQGQQMNILWTDDWNTGKGLFDMKITFS